ncbi:hypothetical protein NVS55_40265 (plasmid) [Myxococcus stipitatus]|uniref:hypothetical protein n=1 Tax=Myxococcus stipitatus TaxID=83455 RepID=UPI0031452BB6
MAKRERTASFGPGTMRHLAARMLMVAWDRATEEEQEEQLLWREEDGGWEVRTRTGRVVRRSCPIQAVVTRRMLELGRERLTLKERLRWGLTEGDSGQGTAAALAGRMLLSAWEMDLEDTLGARLRWDEGEAEWGVVMDATPPVVRSKCPIEAVIAEAMRHQEFRRRLEERGTLLDLVMEVGGEAVELTTAKEDWPLGN